MSQNQSEMYVGKKVYLSMCNPCAIRVQSVRAGGMHRPSIALTAKKPEDFFRVTVIGLRRHAPAGGAADSIATRIPPTPLGG